MAISLERMKMSVPDSSEVSKPISRESSFRDCAYVSFSIFVSGNKWKKKISGITCSSLVDSSSAAAWLAIVYVTVTLLWSRCYFVMHFCK